MAYNFQTQPYFQPAHFGPAPVTPVPLFPMDKMIYCSERLNILNKKLYPQSQTHYPEELGGDREGEKMSELTRREMLGLLSKSAAMLGLSGILAKGLEGHGIAAPENPLVKAVESSRPKPGRSLVTVVRGNDLRRMARDSLESVGGAKGLIQPGQTVFIKPNLVTAQGAAFRPVTNNGECTKPEIIMTVTEEYLKAGASEEIIGEWRSLKKGTPPSVGLYRVLRCINLRNACRHSC